MMRHFRVWLMVAASWLAASTPFAGAHFKLLEPASWLVENDLGDPQKLGPCGGTSANAGSQSNVVSRATGGQRLHIKLQIAADPRKPIDERWPRVIQDVRPRPATK